MDKQHFQALLDTAIAATDELTKLFGEIAQIERSLSEDGYVASEKLVEQADSVLNQLYFLENNVQFTF